MATKKTTPPQSAPASGSELRFTIKAGTKTYEGRVRCPDDDGTTTLPMMVNSLIKEVACSQPYLHTVKSITIHAEMSP